MVLLSHLYSPQPDTDLRCKFPGSGLVTRRKYKLLLQSTAAPDFCDLRRDYYAKWAKAMLFPYFYLEEFSCHPITQCPWQDSKSEPSDNETAMLPQGHPRRHALSLITDTTNQDRKTLDLMHQIFYRKTSVNKYHLTYLTGSKLMPYQIIQVILPKWFRKKKRK